MAIPTFNNAENIYLSQMSQNMYDRISPLQEFFTQNWKMLMRPELYPTPVSARTMYGQGEPTTTQGYIDKAQGGYGYYDATALPWNQPGAQEAWGLPGTISGGNLDYPVNTYDIYNLPTYAPLYNAARDPLEAQYNRAKDQILASGAQGGALTSALQELENQRAYNVGSLTSNLGAQLVEKELANAYQAAYGQFPATVMSGMGTAASNQQAANNASLNYALQSANQTDDSKAGLSMLGMGAGNILGQVLGGPLGGQLGSTMGNWLGGGASAPSVASPASYFS